jgi:hypothetical protein
MSMEGNGSGVAQLVVAGRCRDDVLSPTVSVTAHAGDVPSPAVPATRCRGDFQSPAARRRLWSDTPNVPSTLRCTTVPPWPARHPAPSFVAQCCATRSRGLRTSAWTGTSDRRHTGTWKCRLQGVDPSTLMQHAGCRPGRGGTVLQCLSHASRCGAGPEGALRRTGRLQIAPTVQQVIAHRRSGAVGGGTLPLQSSPTQDSWRTVSGADGNRWGRPGR